MSRDSLNDYIQEVARFPLLTGKQEREFFDRVRASDDQEARDAIVRANLRLVVNISRTYQGNGLSFPDLIEAGNHGLLEAVKRYDPGEEERFANFAAGRIRRR